MFRDWLNNNKVEDFEFSAPLFPKASEREAWQHEAFLNNIQRAEEYLDYAWPSIKATDYIAFKTEGSRLKHEDIHMARRNALNALFLGELAEYKGRFIPQIVNGIFSICEETYWGLSAHFPPANYRHNIPEPDDGYIDLFAAETASALSIIYYILYDELLAFCPEILTRIEYEMNRRIIKSYLTHRDWFWQGYNVPINNWNPWIISNLLTVFLIVEKSNTVRNEGLRKMLFEIDNIYQSYPNDGGCDEGMSYWAVSGGALGEFCEQLYVATNEKINFFKDKKLGEIAKYPSRLYIGNDYVVNFADGGNKILGGGKQVVDSYIYGRRLNDLSLLSFAGELTKKSLGTKEPFLRGSYLFSAIYKAVNLNDILSYDKFCMPNTVILPDTQVSAVRRGEWYSAAKGGNNAERHNHNDVGSFILYHKNMPVLVDPSCGVYTAQTFHGDRYGIWTMQSAWHNTPVLNGFMQEHGKQFNAEAFNANEENTMVGFAGAYPTEADLKRLDRSITLTEASLSVCDKFEFVGNKNTVCEHFVTPLAVEITEKGAVIGGKYLLKADGKFSTDSVDFCGDRNLTAYWNTEKMNRIIVEYECGIKAEIEITVEELNA